MATKKPTKPTKPTELVPWNEKFAKFAKAAAAKTGTIAGNFVGTAGGILKVDKVAVPNNLLECICLDFIFENCLYEGSFDADNPQPPVCFALGSVEADLKPHADSESPQCATCAACPLNEWGSAEKGRGKMCKNTRRIGLIAADAVEGDILAAKVHYLKIPPTSLAAWDGYVKQMADTLQRPPFALVTSIKCVPNPKGGFQFEIGLKERLEDVLEDADQQEVFDALETKVGEVERAIGFPYAPMSAEDREAARQPKKVARPAKFTRTAVK